MQTAVGTFDRSVAVDPPAVNEWAVRFLPSLTDLVFLLPLFILYALLPGSRLLLADADMGWHIRTGEWILDHHRVPVQDPFSFTRPNAPWFAWEWGWDVCFAVLHRCAGLPGVVVVNTAILGFVSVLTFRLVRRACGNDLVSFLVTGIAMCGSTVHWLARPHLTSWIFFLVFAHLIARASEGNNRVLWALPPLTVLWTNLHGSFFLGLFMLAMAAFAPWLEWAIHGGAIVSAWRKSKAFLFCLLGCAAATFVNPYGWHLHRHIVRYLGDHTQMDRMQEFQSLNFHHAPAPFFELMLFLGAASLLWCAQERRWDGFLTILVWGHLALFAARNVPLYLFLASPWIGCMLDRALRSQSRPTFWLRDRFKEIATDFQPLERRERFYLAAAAGFAFVACGIASGRANFTARFDPKSFPESALKIVDHYQARRVFARDQWSAYLLYQRFPKLRVFIDDRSDFYGAEMLDRTEHILQARWDWEADLLRFSADMVIVTPEAPLATVLKSSPRWQLLLDDRAVIVFARRPVRGGQPPPDSVRAKQIQPLLATEEASLGLGEIPGGKRTK